MGMSLEYLYSQIYLCREHLRVNKAGLKINGSPSAIGDHVNHNHNHNHKLIYSWFVSS